tara:strand:- start:11906 stop:12373 length:468 start_codon:yes stop_codon:yes gene_type:complete
MKLSEFKNTKPRFLLEEYFVGNCKAWGVFESRRGKIKNQFSVDIKGTWDGQKLILNEDFIFSNGHVDNRLWTITKIGKYGYQGTAEGVVGKAVGEVSGQAFRWNYKFKLQVGTRKFIVNFDDWMFLQDEKILINRAVLRKFGFVVGRVWLFFERS